MTLNELFHTRYAPHAARALKPKTVAEYTRLAAREILPRYGDRLIDSITLDDAEALHAAVPGAVQANRAVALLSAILSFAVSRRLLAVNPCPGVVRNREQGREFFYTPAQTRALIVTAARSDDIRWKYLAVTLLAGTRPEELRNSGPGWRYGNVLRLPDSKTGVGSVYLPDAACAILDGLPVLHRTPGDAGYYFPAGMNTRRAWGHLCQAAGVPTARRYDLRHTFASAALASGASLPVIGRLLRHRKAQTTLRYAHLSPDVGLDAAAATAARMGA